MTVITQQDFIQSIADALQFMSYYHPADYLHALHQAWKQEESTSAKDAMGQILINSRMCAEGRRPICQDTGMVVAFIRVGMDVQWQAKLSVQEMVDEGVRQAYGFSENILRASMVADPAGARINTGDNTPAMVHVELVQGNRLEVKIAAKGGGSENKARFAVLNPSASLADWVVETVAGLGAGWCPPGIIGVGIGGSAEKAMIMAKESLMEPIDIHELRQRGAGNRAEELRLELFERINGLGIGAQGLGGLATVLDVKVMDYPTHAASLPVALIPNCAATRHVEFSLDGTGPVVLQAPRLKDWPQIAMANHQNLRRIHLDHITPALLQSLKPGEQVLLSGKLLTGRDAAHKRIQRLLEQGEPLPDGLDFRNRFIYYVGPVDPVRDEVVGPAGPTTATRMDKYTEMMLGELGLVGMIGKAERGSATIASIKQHKAVYLMAVGGAAYLVSTAIRSSRMVAFADLGMEAIREFEVEDMPVTVAVNSAGESVHTSGPKRWRIRIEEKKKKRNPEKI